MGKCPNCMKEYREYKKKWKYGRFDVEAYACDCGTIFREYTINGKYNFTLRRIKKGRGWKKCSPVLPKSISVVRNER
jgi:hypothetical protein